MILQFRQGIVRYNEPVMVQVNFPNVDLIASVDSPLLVNIASGEHNYLHAEAQNITSAWTGLSFGTDVWLYLDLDRRTAQRTFGITFFEPIVGTSAPVSPANGQHWFDLTVNEMKVWSGSTWVTKIRVFVCMLQGGSVPVSMSINSPTSFAGTQIGNTNTTSAGYILFDLNNSPITGTNGSFITTEDNIRVNSVSTSEVKVGSLVISATTTLTIPAYTIVEFTDFGKVSPATAWTTSVQKQYGIVEKAYLINETALISIDGVITNTDWDWTSVGINAYLYNDNNGALVTAPVIPQQQPVAIVTDVNAIMLIPKVIITSLPTPYATAASVGTVQLNIPPVDPDFPIAVGDNDPRLAVADTKLDLAGGTMTGSLILAGDPTLNLEATTKQYVDVAVSTVVNNLVWLSPIADPDLVTDDLSTPPVPIGDEVYIIGAAPTGVWVGMAGHAVRWVDSAWVDILNRPVAVGDRFGVAIEFAGVSTGGLTGLEQNIVEITDATPGALVYDVTVATKGQAVLANGDNSRHFGHQYTFNGTQWVEILGSINLDQLTDVVLTGPVTGQALTYNGTQWVNATPTTTLVGLTDVTIAGPVAGQALTFDGIEWVNATPVSSLAGLSDVVLGVPVTGQSLVYDGATWISANPDIDSLSNVIITAPTLGQSLTYNGAEWINSAPVSSLDGLSDVVITTPTTGQSLTYNGTQWVNTAAGGGSFASLTDVTLTSPTNNHIAVFNGVDWVNTDFNPTWVTQYTWGRNDFGQFGVGAAISVVQGGYAKPVPRSAQQILRTADIAITEKMGTFYNGAAKIKKDGTLWAWGEGFYGALGQGNSTTQSSPVQIGADSTWSYVSTGLSAQALMMIKTDGTLWACGYNKSGQLGLGDLVHRSSPVQVGALNTWRSVACSYSTMAAIKTDGTLWMCGYNFNGQLGLGDIVHRSSPVQIGALTDWDTVACAYGATVARKTDGSLWAWGYNNVGRLGLGDTLDRSSPVQIGTLTDWREVSAGSDHFIATKTDGTLWAWGRNNAGQLGIGNAIDRSSPTQVGLDTTWVDIACGYYHSVATKTDGTLWTWGLNTQGELGDGTTTSTSSPILASSLLGWTKPKANNSTTFVYRYNDNALLFAPTANDHFETNLSFGSMGFSATNSVSKGIKTISVSGTLAIANGGTGQTTANAALNALLPTQTGNGGKFLTTNGTDTSWAVNDSGTVTSVDASGGTTGLTFTGGPVTTSGTLTLSGTLAIANGGTGQTTATNAINALVPDQTGNNGKVLSTNGTVVSWIAAGGSGTVTSVDVSGGTTGLTTSGGPVTTSGTITLAGTLALTNGGTGQTTANAALNALLPTQTGNGGKALTTNGTDTQWTTLTTGTVTSVSGSGGTTGLTLTGGPITTTGTLTLGGTLGYANGGTGLATLGTALQVLRTNAGATAIEWATIGGSGTVTSVDASGGTTGLSFTGGPVTTSGTLTLSGTLAITNGGTGQTTASGAINALVPDQTGNSGKFLTTNGTVISWGTPAGVGTVTSVDASGGTTGLTFTGGPVTTSGTLTLSGTLAYTNGGTGLTTLGTGLQVLRTNAGATAMEWATVSGTGTVTSVDASGGTTGLTFSGGPVTTSGTLTLSGTLAYTNGGTGLATLGTALQVLRTNAGATAIEWATVGGGATLSDDTTTNATRYIAFADATSGSWSTAYVSSTKLYFNPSTGTLGATVFNSLSDIQFKTNVEPIVNAVDTINQLDGVKFDWKENGKTSYGVIAQELEKILPDLVEGDEVKTVNYSGLIGFLLNAVKELDQRVKELESK